MKIMKVVCLFLLSFSFLSVQAQKTPKAPLIKQITVDMNFDKLFDKVIDFSQENGYFIASVDKDAGFIQTRRSFKNKSFFSSVEAERWTLNFVVRKSGENQSTITLNMSWEELLYRNSDKSDLSFYIDRGMLEKPEQYQAVFDELLASLQE